jgi:hypothetical protein
MMAPKSATLTRLYGGYAMLLKTGVTPFFLSN